MQFCLTELVHKNFCILQRNVVKRKQLGEHLLRFLTDLAEEA